MSFQGPALGFSLGQATRRLTMPLVRWGFLEHREERVLTWAQCPRQFPPGSHHPRLKAGAGAPTD